MLFKKRKQGLYDLRFLCECLGIGFYPLMETFYVTNTANVLLSAFSSEKFTELECLGVLYTKNFKFFFNRKHTELSEFMINDELRSKMTQHITIELDLDFFKWKVLNFILLHDLVNGFYDEKFTESFSIGLVNTVLGDACFK